MNSGLNTFTDHVSGTRALARTQNTRSKVGFPIRKSSDQSSFAAPQGLSQRTTSFIASQRQGIHRMLLRHLITLMIDVRRLQLLKGTPGDTHNQKDHVFGSLRRRCLPNAPEQRTRSRPRWSPDTRWSGYQAHSLFTISNITRDRCGRARSSKTFPDIARRLVEPDGIEPTTSCLQSTRSPN